MAKASEADHRLHSLTKRARRSTCVSYPSLHLEEPDHLTRNQTQSFPSMEGLIGGDTGAHLLKYGYFVA